MPDRADVIARDGIGIMQKWSHSTLSDVEYLAQVLRAYGEEARREEREACATLADHGGPDAPWDGRDQRELDNIALTAKRIAAAIRAREEKG